MSSLLRVKDLSIVKNFGLFFVGICEIFATKQDTTDDLGANIRHVVYDIRPKLLQKVVINWTSGLRISLAIRGGHVPEIKFKYQCPKI